jgi:6-phosphogluconolactonase
MHRTRTIALALGLFVALVLTATAAATHPGSPVGAVYTLTNSPGGNAVLAYARDADGSLSGPESFPTGGTGTGGGLGSQGALVLSDNRRELYAVNAGSNSITLFSVTKDGLEAESTAPSGGTMPISIAVHDDLLYVLNAGGTPNITGFSTRHDTLTPLAGSTRPLGVSSAGPAQVSFSPDGRVLVVTEKNTSTIDTYAVGHDGLPDAPATFASAGATPFGFDFDRRGNLLVSDAGGTASSYSLSREGRVNVITGAVDTHQGAPCWLVTSKDGRFAYTANGGTGTISGFSVDHDGGLTLLDANGVTADLGATSHPLDEAVSKDGRYLYNLTDGTHSISGLSIGNDGGLTDAGTTGGLPVGAAGIAAS